ncbi:unnamed protein product, partial [Allacma fusca]
DIFVIAMPGVITRRLQCSWVPIDPSNHIKPQEFNSPDEDRLAAYYLPIALIGFLASVIIVGISYLLWTYCNQVLRRTQRHVSFLPVNSTHANVADTLEGTQIIDYPSLTARVHRIQRLNDSVRVNESASEAPPPTYDELFSKP